MFILKKGHQPGVYVPLRALFSSFHLFSIELYAKTKAQISAKGADQLRCNHTADQCLCLSYIDITIPLLLKSKISSL